MYTKKQCVGEREMKGGNHNMYKSARENLFSIRFA